MKRFIKWILLIGFLGATIYSYSKYKLIYGDNVDINEKTYFTIATGSNYDTVFHKLQMDGILRNPENFTWVARKMNYPNHVKAGRYLIQKNMSNRELLQMFRSGDQEAVRLVINSLRTKQDLAGLIGNQLEADSQELMQFLGDQARLEKLGYNADNIMSIFIPNSYKIYWNTTIDQFINRMLAEHKKFWSSKRTKQAEKLNLEPSEVFILASIVEQEILLQAEAPTVAGVYLNRLRRNMKLDADPTIIFANGDFSLKRVLNIHKKIDSPYNTYKNRGLPPGPICLPSIRTIDAVLNAERHDYLYFCADASFDGTHHFSSTYREHKRYARTYQAELNKRRIYK